MNQNQAVPFVDLVTAHRELEPELVDAFRVALRSAAFVGGAEVDAFEREFAAYCGAGHCVGVGSGTDALRFALMAAGVGRGDAVVTVSHTFIATVEAILQAGADAEFVDIDPDTYCMSPESLEEYLAACSIDPATGRPLGARTRKPIRAIVPVHLYGQVARVDALLSIAARYGLLTIEDACQAHGAAFQRADRCWSKAGTFGAAAAFSFYPGKNLGACGEGGAVTTNDAEVAARIRMLRDHGQARKYYHELEGYNGRLDAIQAAFLRVKMRHLDRWNEERRAAAAAYTELLSAIPGVVPPIETSGSRHVYHLYVIRAAARDALARHLSARGVTTGLHYPLPIHLQKCFSDWGCSTGSLPVTERAAAEILSLPIFPGLARSAQQHVVESIADAFVDVAPATIL